MISTILTQHAEDAALLWLQRQGAIHAPHFRLRHLARLDERLGAHLDGLCVAAEEGRAWPRDEDGELPGSLFTEAVVALYTAPERLDAILTRTQALPDRHAEIMDALAWVDAACLQGTVKKLLDSGNPFHRRIGLEACVRHRVDPGAALSAAFDSDDIALRQTAIHTAGVLKRLDLREACLNLLRNPTPSVSAEAAYAVVLLGDRSTALAQLADLVLAGGMRQSRALDLYMLAASPEMAHAMLQQLIAQPPQIRNVIIGSGVVGDTRYLPWLLQQMEQATLARIAADSFAMICGIDLLEMDLEGEQPKGFEAGPNDDPEDPDTAMDPDENRPWPDLTKIQAWWQANAPRFASGQCLFAGLARSPDTLAKVLRDGTQRQRALAALWLTLHVGDGHLFDVAAPAHRQRIALRAMIHDIS